MDFSSGYNTPMSHLDHKAELLGGLLAFIGIGILIGFASGVAVTTIYFDRWHCQEHGYHYLSPAGSW